MSDAKGDHLELLRQQIALARFGELALRSEDLDEILTEACRLVGEALGTELAKVVELQEDGQTLLVRAGVGWKPGVVGVATVKAADDTSEGHALKTGRPMISPDIAEETRFRYPAFLTDNGVKAVANVAIIGGRDRPPFGILQIDSRTPRRFTDEDTAFLGGYANLIAAAVDRLRATGELRAGEARLRASGARQAFLLALGDRLRDLADPREVMQAAAGLLGRHLSADRAGYAEIDVDGTFTVERDWCAPGMPSLAGRHRLDDFGPALIAELRAGHAVAFEDALTGPLTPGEEAAAAYRGAGTRAAITVPLVKAGRFAAALYVHAREPRSWTGEDEALAHEVAERTWAAVERARAEAELRDSRQQLQMALDAARMGTFDWNPLSDRLALTNHSAELFGFLPGKLPPTAGDALGIVHPDDVEQHHATFLEASGRAEDYHLEYRVVRPCDGRVVWIEERGSTVPDPATGQTRVKGIIWDVTERRVAELSLRESEERLRLALGAGGLGDYEWDFRTDAVRASDRAREIFAFGPGEGGHAAEWFARVAPEDSLRARAAVEAGLVSGRLAVEYRICPPVGADRHVLCHGLVTRDADGRPMRLIGVLADETGRRRMEDELHQLNQALERRVAERTAKLMAAEATLRQSQKMEAVGQLTGGIAHDFNNMLQGISGSLEILQRRAAQGRMAEVDRHAEGARKSVERAAALTHRLLAFARRQTLLPKPVNADALVKGMAELVQRTMGPGVVVELRLHDGNRAVLCDPNQLESALLNLAINARDAMPDGGTLTIATTDASMSPDDVGGEEGAEAREYVEIAVSDNGTGMDEATKARAFEPFFTTKPIGQGTGLGLSQLYGFVRQSGGIVRLDSTPGQGTTVRLCLPRHEPASRQEHETRPQDTRPQDGPEGAVAVGGSVLLVEDDAGVRAATAEWLRELGHRVLDVADGSAALRVLHSGRRLDLLVTDVGLPGGLNGRQVADAARERSPGLPVLFITGYAGAALAGQLAPGMAVIVKPFALSILAGQVRDLIGVAPVVVPG